MKPANEVTPILRREFPKEAVKQRPIPGGGRVDYVEGHAVILRLIEATENQFDVRVVNFQLIGDLATATVELTIPGLGSRQHIGVQRFKAGSGEDLLKGCITDGLKKAATLFGVALELYGDDYEAAGELASPAKPQSKPAAKTAPSQSPSDASTQELGKRRRDQVAAIVQQYDWSLEKAASWLRANRSMQRWSELTENDIQAMTRMLEQANEIAPPANTGRAEQGEQPADGERDWIAEINASRSRAELAKVANDLIKTVKDKSHPARARLDARFKELDRKAVAV